jgi:hypothetical protein
VMESATPMEAMSSRCAAALVSGDHRPSRVYDQFDEMSQLGVALSACRVTARCICVLV